MAIPFTRNTKSEEVTHPAVVDRSKIYLPPLHIKLDLIKIFVKATD
jgi:hypothetical protein